jgi:hypothetical protein
LQKRQGFDTGDREEYNYYGHQKLISAEASWSKLQGGHAHVSRENSACSLVAQDRASENGTVCNLRQLVYSSGSVRGGLALLVMELPEITAELSTRPVA